MAIVRSRVVSGDLNNFAEMYERFLPGGRVIRTEDRNEFHWSAQLAKSKGRTLWRAQHNRNVTTTIVGNGCYFGLSFPTVGAVRTKIGRRIAQATPGQVLVLRHPTEMETVCSHERHERLTLMWNTEEWAGILVSLAEENPTGGLELDRTVEFDDVSRGRFMRLLEAVAADITDTDHDLGLASLLMNEALLRMVLEQPSARSSAPDARGVRAPHRCIRIADEYMRANIGKPFSMSDVARACKVTVRTLEKAFAAHLDVTPLAYLHRLRLGEVHREFKSAVAHVPIAATARRWGFTDLGRFSALYRKEFGELPSETLRRR